LVGAFLVSNGDEPAYVATSKRVNLTWGQCFNGIAWRPARSVNYSWWAGHTPAPTGQIETVPPLAEHSSALHFARGTLHFISRSDATFRSDAGGTLAMRREPDNAFHTADCVGRFPDSTRR
jgi:hypothetical protein